MIGFSVIALGWQIKKGLDLEPTPPKHPRFLLKMLLSIAWVIAL